MLRRFLFVMLAGGLALGVSACNEYRPTAANGRTSAARTGDHPMSDSLDKLRSLPSALEARILGQEEVLDS